MPGLSEFQAEIDRLIHEPARLEEASLNWQEKTIRDKCPHTEIDLTPAGRAAFERHWEQLEALRRQANAASD